MIFYNSNKPKLSYILDCHGMVGDYHEKLNYNKIGYMRPFAGTNDYGWQQSTLILDGSCLEIFQEPPDSSLEFPYPILVNALTELAQSGHTLIATSFDRLAGSTPQLLDLLKTLSSLDIRLEVLDGEFIFNNERDYYNYIACLEPISKAVNRMNSEARQIGINNAKKEDRYRGRKPIAEEKKDEVIQLDKQGINKKDISQTVKIGVASVYRILREHRISQR